MEEFRFIFLQRLANGIELLSAVVLLIGFAKTMWAFLLYEIQEIRSNAETTAEGLSILRPIMTNYLLLGLDFYLLSVLISTMIHVDWIEILRLAVVGLLRVGMHVKRNAQA